MKRYFYIIAFIVLFIAYILNFTVWNEENTEWDCKYKKFFAEIKKNPKFLDWLNIIDKKTFSQAVDNFSKYCAGDWKVLQTPVFVNHLVDVAFRKLDAIDWLTYWVKPHPLWLSRRNFLNSVSQTYKVPPEKIKDQFVSYWGKDNKWNLYNLYKEVCAEIWKIAWYVSNNDSLNFDSKSSFKQFNENKCNELADMRYYKELSFVKKLMFQSFYTIVSDKLYKYFNTNFANKLMDLYDNFIITLWDFDYLVLRFMKVTNANQ